LKKAWLFVSFDSRSIPVAHLPQAPLSPVDEGIALSDVHDSARRIHGIDAARGMAMLLVCLSHFTNTAFRLNPDSSARHVLVHVGMVASPTFMLISGMMLGLLYETRRESFGGIARGLIGRGLFLLTVAHVLILLAVLPDYQTVRISFITDVIGVAVVTGPFLMHRLGVGARLGLAVASMASGVAMSVLWFPATSVGGVMRYLLAGPWGSEMPGNFPLLPWMALYLFGSTLGGWIARLQVGRRYRAIELGLIGVGSAGVCLGVAANFVFDLIGVSGAIGSLASPTQKFPPSPAYLAFFGGCGLIMTGFLLIAQRLPISPITTWLRLLGRTSLCVFILQYHVYYLAMRFVPDAVLQFWLILFAASLAFISACAWMWEKAGGNRWYNMLDWFGGARRRRGEPARRAGAVAMG
jgi:hypothetical protein